MENFTIKDLQNFEIDINISTLILSLLVSAICALVVKYFYKKYSQSINNKDNFSNIFVLLATTTTIVITVVKFSLALSLGLVGALSIVRFRAAIKEPEELVYLFLIIAIGLASGSGQLITAIILTIFANGIIYLQFFFKKKKSIHSDVDILNIECPSNSYDQVEKKIINFSQNQNLKLQLKSFSKENYLIFLTFIIFDESNGKSLDLLIKEIRNIDIDKLKINLTKGVPIAL
ncbi:DUF4956 domain-containing protein [Candidatus Pelagibacter ubique]|jgi:hypothetical protein|nr:DUF4956 domain-containing protein [Candidatus Pelagibacter ubique]